MDFEVQVAWEMRWGQWYPKLLTGICMWTSEQDGNFLTAIKYHSFNQLVSGKAKKTAAILHNQI